MIYCCCDYFITVPMHLKGSEFCQEPSGCFKHCLQEHDALRMISIDVHAFPQESKWERYGCHRGQETTGNELAAWRVRLAPRLHLSWNEALCSGSNNNYSTKSKAAGQHRAAASSLLLFANSLILHYTIQAWVSL